MFELKNLVRKNIIGLEAYSSARSEYTSTADVFLDANENPFGNRNRYPDPYQQTLKQKLHQQNGVAVENIFIGNGSDEVIDLVFRVFCTPGVDKVLSFVPTYGMYKVAAAINNVEMLEMPLDQSFQIDKNTLKAALKEPDLKVVFLCSPNNPTGNCLNELEAVLDNFNGIVMLDEAYIDFANCPSFLQKLSKYPQLIITQTLSKAWGLAAARIGIGYASEEIIGHFNKTKPPYNVSVLNQEAAMEALSDVAGYERNKRILLEEKAKLEAQLSSIAIVTKIYPSDANFLFIETIDAVKIYNGLLAQGIVVRNRNKVVENCIRISIGTPGENEKLIRSLLQIQSSLF